MSPNMENSNIKQKPILERKSSFDNDILQRRNSMIAYKKIYMNICLNFNNLLLVNSNNTNNQINQNIKDKEENLKYDNNINKNITQVSQPANADIFKIQTKNSNQLNENNKIFFNIYQNFFNLENSISDNDGGSNQNFFNNEFKSNQINGIIDEDTKNKHYESDTDIPKMRKFVYEKLENINKEVVLKSMKKKNIIMISSTNKSHHIMITIMNCWKVI